MTAANGDGRTLAEPWHNPGRTLAEPWQNPGRTLAEPCGTTVFHEAHPESHRDLRKTELSGSRLVSPQTPED